MSTYPDGTANPEWFKHLEVALPLAKAKFQVLPREILEIACHRRVNSLEQYLVRWRHPSTTIRSLARFWSWHDLSELIECLQHVQIYVDGLMPRLAPQKLQLPPHSKTRKRKTPDSDTSDTPLSTTKCSTPSSSTTQQPYDEPSTYNCTLGFVGNVVTMQPLSSIINIELPTPSMIDNAARTPTTQAAYRISNAFDLRLKQAAGTVPLSIYNKVDSSRPSLAFQFITKSVIGEGVEPVTDDVVLGCGRSRVPGQPQVCRPDMGQNMGCEYARVCECMEYASVDEARLKPEEKALYEAGEVAALPKRFPYHASDPPTLQAFYLNSRAEIYECNPNCNCGPGCKTRCVQNGRRVPLEIFKTKNRGWGLRCLVDLRRGQFIDTYVGEIITNAEADRREESSGPGKASYLFSLDKFVDEDLLEEDCYVVDGEMMGNVTRFINHSCEPNCRQYTVSYNKYDRKVYELAFFAYENIPAGTELTFDYMDKDEEGEEEDTSPKEPVSEEQRCRCGARNCRGRVWY